MGVPLLGDVCAVRTAIHKNKNYFFGLRKLVFHEKCKFISVLITKSLLYCVYVEKDYTLLL